MCVIIYEGTVVITAKIYRYINSMGAGNGFFGSSGCRPLTDIIAFIIIIIIFFFYLQKDLNLPR